MFLIPPIKVEHFFVAHKKIGIQKRHRHNPSLKMIVKPKHDLEVIICGKHFDLSPTPISSTFSRWLFETISYFHPGNLGK